MKGGDKFEKQSTNRVNIKVHSKSNRCIARVTQQVFSRVLKTGIQYLLDDSIQTSVQEYLASQSDNSCNPFKRPAIKSQYPK